MKDSADFGWTTKPLGDLVDVLDKLRKPITKSDRIAGPYPYYGATGVLDYVDGYLFDEPLVLIGEDGAKWEAGANSAFSIAGKTWVNNHAHVIRPHRDKVLDDWLIYYLNGADLMPFVSGMTVPKLNQGRLREIPIPLPPLEEQQRIVAVLDEAFEGMTRARAHVETNLQNARELFAGTISAEFSKIDSSEKRRVGDVAVHSLGKMLDKNKNKGILRPYLRNINVRWFTVDTSDLLEMRITDAEVERYTVKKGDLLICEGGYPGRSSIWEQDEEIFFQKALHRVRFEDETYSRLLMYYLFMSHQSGALQEHCSGAGIQHFTGQSLAKFEIPFPTLDVAKKMISTIEEMQRSSTELEGHFQKKLEDLDDLRQSLLHKAFAGELT